MRLFAHRLSPLLLLLFGAYLALYPGSLIVVALDQVPSGGGWFGGLLIMLQGLLCGLWLTANYGRRGLLAAASILALSFSVEHIGVTTGFPFGSYSYTDLLWPKLLGTVPLAIPFAWLLIVPASIETARYLRRLDGSTSGKPFGLGLALVGATMALLMDIVLEPVVTLVNGYWIWAEGSSYYGVPLANFVAWWYTALALSVITLLLTGLQRAPQVLPLLPFWLYLLSMFMFNLVNLAHGHIAAGAIGALIFGYLLFCRLERRLVRWVLEGKTIFEIGLRRADLGSSSDS